MSSEALEGSVPMILEPERVISPIRMVDDDNDNFYLIDSKCDGYK